MRWELWVKNVEITFTKSKESWKKWRKKYALFLLFWVTLWNLFATKIPNVATASSKKILKIQLKFLLFNHINNVKTSFVIGNILQKIIKCYWKQQKKIKIINFNFCGLKRQKIDNKMWYNKLKLTKIPRKNEDNYFWILILKIM